MTVGKSKTEHGTGRVRAAQQDRHGALTAWAQHFPDRKPVHYVFPSERVGFSGNDETPQVFDTDPPRRSRRGRWLHVCQWESRGVGHCVLCELRVRDLQRPWRVMNLQPVWSILVIQVVQAVAFGQEIFPTPIDRVKSCSNRSIVCGQARVR